MGRFSINITDYTWLREYIIEVSTVNDLLGDIQFIIKLGTPCRNRLVLQTGPGFSPGTSVSSTNITDCHEINEIHVVSKVVLNTHNPPLIEAKIHFEKCELLGCFFSICIGTSSWTKGRRGKEKRRKCWRGRRRRRRRRNRWIRQENRWSRR